MHSDLLESALRDDRFVDAEEILEEMLVEEPSSHWLWTTRAMCVRHCGRETDSLAYARKAVELAPACPLAQWELGSAFEACEKWDEAIEVYSAIISRGVEGLEADECYEGVSWSRGLIADCWYYKSLCLLELDRFEEAEAAFDMAMGLRRAGQHTVLPVREARRQYRELKGERLERLNGGAKGVG